MTIHTVTTENHNCGHSHRTIRAAIVCRAKLLSPYGVQGNTWAAKWHNASITNATEEDITSALYDMKS